jgi:hypothetical protein
MQTIDKICTGLGAFLVVAVVVMIWAVNDYRESEHRLHNVYVLYPTAQRLTDADLDSYADKVAAAANVSQYRGRRIVEALLRARIDPGVWIRVSAHAPHFWASQGDRIAAEGLTSN